MRDQLKATLAGISSPPNGDESPDPASGAPLSTAELAERIKALKAVHTVDVTPERTATRRLDVEEPVSTRIQRRAARTEIEYENEMPPSAGDQMSENSELQPTNSAPTVRRAARFSRLVARDRQQPAVTNTP